jgi:hypothetical protein
MNWLQHKKGLEINSNKTELLIQIEEHMNLMGERIECVTFHVL